MSDPIDASWSFERISEEKMISIKKGDLDRVCSLTFMEARIVFEEGKNPNYILVEYHKLDLKLMKVKKLVEKVKIITAGDKSCVNCRVNENRIMTLDDAIRLNPLPCLDCTHDYNEKKKCGWCRCLYVPTF